MGSPITPPSRTLTLSLIVPLVALGLAAAAPAGARPDDPVPHEKKAAPAKPLPPPIMFFITRGDANACGPGCREWIAAEGTIDAGADDRLRALLKRLGSRKLPIYFHSPGGRVEAALAIGRIMRARGLTAGVGRTLPVGCDPRQAREPACERLKRSGRELLGDLETSGAMCNSACVFMLAGAARRDVAAGVRLGIHSVRFVITSRSGAAGHAVRAPRRVAPGAEQRALGRIYQSIGAYLDQMGIAPRLLAAAREISSDHLRYLSRDEVAAFGIDRREIVEGLWQLFGGASDARAVKVIEARETGTGVFRTTTLSLSCASQRALKLRLRREVGAVREGLSPALRLTAGASRLALGRAVTFAVTRAETIQALEADLPISILGETGFAIEADAPAGAAPESGAVTGFAPVTAASFGPGLTLLARHCAAPPAAPRSTSTVERIMMRR